MGFIGDIINRVFLSTLSLRRATRLCSGAGNALVFLSTLSLRRATRKQSCPVRPPGYFYPRSPCGERHVLSVRYALFWYISIHALLAESDSKNAMEINGSHGFLSTLSLRRATPSRKYLSSNTSHFYPRSPCGERPGQFGVCGLPTIISIHALLAESDLYFAQLCAWLPYFYPRSPCGERPTGTLSTADASGISIHALLAESDLTLEHVARCIYPHFYPRSPCGERRAGHKHNLIW